MTRQKAGEIKTEAGALEQHNREAYFALIKRHLPALYRFVRHVVTYLEAVGDLAPGELTPEDVVDTAVLRAHREFPKEASRRNIRGRLVRLARDYIEAEVRRQRLQRKQTLPKEEDVPETPPNEWVTALGEEILYFYEPEEDLKLEDVVPDLDVPTPEEETERKETWRCVDRALMKMPREWREALLLKQVDGLTGAELADALRKPEAETRRILEQAQNYLRERLIEAGCDVKTQDDRRP